MRTFNKRGDLGETSLLYGGRIPKSHERTEAYGTIDEAVSALGLARAFTSDQRIAGFILRFQQELFTAGAEIATDPDQLHKLESNFRIIRAEDVDGIESLIGELEEEMEPPSCFVIPGSSPAGAALDLARTIIRRCERRCVVLRERNLIRNDSLLAYLNRLADFIFLLARLEEAREPEATGERRGL